MAGDYSRVRFQPDKHFAGVLLQQGRVQIDSDWNEAEAIRDHRFRILVRDLLGPAAFPGPGFAVATDGSTLRLGAGHAWVDGLLCELAGDVPLDQQPDVPVPVVPDIPGSYLVYLEVWQREVSAAEDETLREPALGGPDTSVRLATVAQARLSPVANVRRTAHDWSPPAVASDARLAVRGRYVGLESRLYRIEIHDDGSRDRATYKWSRDNGSAVVGVRAWTPDELTLCDTRLPYAAGDHLEIVDRVSTLERRPGWIVEVARVDADRVMLAPSSRPAPDRVVGPLARRWDGAPVPVAGGRGGWQDLGDGLRIRFEGTTYRTGDFWLFAARPADGGVTWPDAAGVEDGARPPHGVFVHRAPLALARRSATSWTVLRDLRRPPLR